MAPKRPVRTGIMLAHPLDARRFSKLPPRVFVQPKLRGERCRVHFLNNGTPILLSSYGNKFQFLDHIEESLVALPDEFKKSWDGEIYCHSLTQEDINSRANQKKKPHPDRDVLKLTIFDFGDTDMVQWERAIVLDSLHQMLHLNGHEAERGLDVIEPLSIYKERIANICEIYVKHGYEGLIIRTPDGVYEEKRSANLLKVKPTEEDEYEIVDVQEGKGRLVGTLGAFVVKDADGKEFSVGTGSLLTDVQRQKLWFDRTELIGKILVVKHELLRTRNNVPVCCSAQRIVEGKEKENG